MKNNVRQVSADEKFFSRVDNWLVKNKKKFSRTTRDLWNEKLDKEKKK